MKIYVIGMAAIMSLGVCILSACASGGGANVPSLSAPAPQTGRVPSPGNIRATEFNQSVRMTAPSAQ